jgi:transcriptional regulator with XRE-family HTH domain
MFEAIKAAIFNAGKTQGISLSELARRTGLPRESISRLQSRQDADFATLAKLAQALGLQLEALPRRPLKLQFNYAWANPQMPRDKLIGAILRRGIFVDILEAVRFWGLARVQAVAQVIDLPAESARMLGNIEKGHQLVKDGKASHAALALVLA